MYHTTQDALIDVFLLGGKQVEEVGTQDQHQHTKYNGCDGDTSIGMVEGLVASKSEAWSVPFRANGAIWTRGKIWLRQDAIIEVEIVQCHEKIRDSAKVPVGC